MLKIRDLDCAAPTKFSTVYPKKVLIVSPHFPPINAPDAQRVRIALPYFQSFGWDAHILAVQPQFVEHSQDARLVETLPDFVPIHRVAALSTQYTRKVGLGNLGIRCFPFLLKEGNRLLSTQSFDLVFFSTTIFPVMALGAYWKQRFRVPFVLDFQDPWLSDYHQTSGTVIPPGGRFKYGVDREIARFLEPRAMKQVGHIVSVSPAYPHILQQRYPWLRANQFTVLPFGAPSQDFAKLPQFNLPSTLFDPQDGLRHWVYVGRGGSDMATALQALFLALRNLRDRDPARWQSVRLHFVGTSYATGQKATKSVEAIAQAYGVADLVREIPERIPYFEAQQLLVDSDAILMIGSDDPSYTASKLYPCLLARKPILAIFHRQSSVVEILHTCKAGQVTTFDTGDRPEMHSPALETQLQTLLDLPRSYEPPTDWKAFEPYTARAMTQKLCASFAQCLQLHPRGTDATC